VDFPRIIARFERVALSGSGNHRAAKFSGAQQLEDVRRGEKFFSKKLIG